MWGYDELLRDPGHADAIQEGDYEALVIFSPALMRREQELNEEN